MAVFGYIEVSLLAGGGEELEILVAWAHKSREPVKRGDFFFTVARNVFFVLSIELASYRQNFRA